MVALALGVAVRRSSGIVCGFMGMKKAKELNGLGKGPSIAGLVIGFGHILLMVVLVVVGMLAGGLAFLAGAMG